jgi:nitric oxide reductase NorE protein
MANHNSGAPARHMPGEGGIWVFIFGDMLVFSVFFMVFLFARSKNLELFADSQPQLNQIFGAINTFLMLTSSWFVASAVHAARHNLGKVVPGCFLGGFVCGLLFVVSKFFEYSEKLEHGITINTNEFFMYYYVFTAIHLLHVLIGMGVLAFMSSYSWSGTGFDSAKIRNLESGASFWHVVDLLWIVLFALLYLIK